MATDDQPEPERPEGRGPTRRSVLQAGAMGVGRVVGPDHPPDRKACNPWQPAADDPVSVGVRRVDDR